MHKITIEFSEEEYNGLNMLSEYLDRPVDDVIRMVINTASKWTQQRVDGGNEDVVIRVMLHSLLDVPRLSLDGNFDFN